MFSVGARIEAIRTRYERRATFTAFLGFAPIALSALLLAFSGDFSDRTRLAVAAAVTFSGAARFRSLRRELACRVLTLSTAIAALRGDAVWFRDEAADDLLAVEVHALAGLLESRRLAADEGAAVLRTLLQLARRDRNSHSRANGIVHSAPLQQHASSPPPSDGTPDRQSGTVGRIGFV